MEKKFRHKERMVTPKERYNFKGVSYNYSSSNGKTVTVKEGDILTIDIVMDPEPISGRVVDMAMIDAPGSEGCRSMGTLLELDTSRDFNSRSLSLFLHSAVDEKETEHVETIAKNSASGLKLIVHTDNVCNMATTPNPQPKQV